MVATILFSLVGLFKEARTVLECQHSRRDELIMLAWVNLFVGMA